jgi:predicted Rossmann-fold nucleotide-binding protein
MDASTQGAQAVGGETISVTFYPDDATNFEGRYIGNRTDEEIVTTNYISRMFKLLEHGDMFVIFKGGSGTISEFGTAWVLAKLYYGHHKPFVLYGRFWEQIIDTLRRNMNIDRDELSVFEIASSKEEVLAAVKKFQGRLERSFRGKL